jgi:hypothetical protein
MTRQELPCTSAKNRLASTNRKRTHQDPDEHDASQSRQIQGNANKTGRLKNLHQCSQGQSDDVNVLKHAPQHQSPGSSQRQTRSMTQRYEPMQKIAILRMLARNAHILRGHHLNPPQRPRIAKYKTLHKENHKG